MFGGLFGGDKQDEAPPPKAAVGTLSVSGEIGILSPLASPPASRTPDKSTANASACLNCGAPMKPDWSSCNTCGQVRSAQAAQTEAKPLKIAHPAQDAPPPAAAPPPKAAPAPPIKAEPAPPPEAAAPSPKSAPAPPAKPAAPAGIAMFYEPHSVLDVLHAVCFSFDVFRMRCPAAGTSDN